MTQDEIMEIAKQAGFDIGMWEKLCDDDDVFGYEFEGIHENLEAFAKLVAEKELTDAQNTIRQLAEKLECYERLADASEMASNPMGVKSREALRNVREMKTIMTKEEEILRAVEAEREACAEIADRLPRIYRETKEAHHRNSLEPFHPSQFGFDFAEIQQAEVITHAIRARSKHD